MKTPIYQNYDDLPLFLNTKLVSEVLGIAVASCYGLMKQEGFPSLRIGNRVVVPKDKFIQWVDEQTGGVKHGV